MKVLCIANPTSGGGKGGKMVAAVHEHLVSAGIDVTIKLTQDRGSARRLAADAVSIRSPDVIVIIGGDGTLSEVVDGMLSSSLKVASTTGIDIPQWSTPSTAPATLPALVYVPAGTGADFARLGFTCRPEQITLALAASNRSSVDVGFVLHCANGETSTANVHRFFINVASIGLGASVVRRAEQLKTWRPLSLLGGFVIFLLASAIELLFVAPVAVCVKPMNDDSFGSPAMLNREGWYKTKATTMAFCNGRFFGGGMMIAPDSCASDGALTLSVWRERFFGFACGLFSVYNGRAARWKSSSTFSFRQCLVTPDPESRSPNRIGFEIDGESGGNLPAFVGVAPMKVVFIIAPQGPAAV